MGVILQIDDLDRTGGLGANWTEQSEGSASIVLDGDKAEPSVSQIATPGQPAGTFHWPLHRAVFNTFDPKTLLPLSSINNVSGGPLQRVTYAATIQMPSALPSPPDVLRVGPVMLENNGSGITSSYEFVYEIDSAGAHWLKVYNRTSLTAFTLCAGSARNLTTIGQELAAGESAVLYLRAVFDNNFVWEIHSWWDRGQGQIAGQVFFFESDICYLSWPSPPPGGLGPGSETFYGGMVMYQEGPSSGPGSFGTGPQLLIVAQDHVAILSWRVVNDAPDPVPQFFPMPVVSAPATLGSVTLDTEDDGSSIALLTPPSYTIPTEPRDIVHEHRSEDGHLVTIAGQTRSRRIWSLVWAGLNATERSGVRNAFISAKATKSHLSWTDAETGELRKVRAIEPPVIELVGSDVWNITAQAEEILV